MSIIKLQFGNDVRRIRLEENQEINFSDLLKLTKETFTEISSLDNFIFKYRDIDNDIVTVTSDLELQEAFRVAKDAGVGSLRFEVQWNGCIFEESLKKVKSFVDKKKALLCPNSAPGECSLDSNNRCKKIFFAGLIGFLMCRGCCIFFLLPLFFIYFIASKLVWRDFNKKAKRTCTKGRNISSEPIVEEIVRQSNVENDEVGSQQPQPFQVKLGQLEEMGFTNRSKNIESLIKNSGDVLKTVKELLEKNN